MSKFTYWYVATPYTRFPAGLEAAFVLAARSAGDLMKEGIPVYAPIAHTHPVAVYGEMDKVDHDLWVRVDQPLLDAASGIIVVTAESWEISRGVAHEIRVMEKSGKPVVYWDPATAIPVAEIRDAMTADERKIAPFKRWTTGAESPWKRFSPSGEAL